MFYEAPGQWAILGLLAKNVPAGSIRFRTRVRYSAGMSFRRASFRLVMAALCALPPAAPMRAVATPARISCDAIALQTPLVAWTAPLSKTARVAALAVRRRLDPLRATWTETETNTYLVHRPGGGALNIRIDTGDDSLFSRARDAAWMKEWLKGEDIPSVPNVIALTLETMCALLDLRGQQGNYDQRQMLDERRELVQKAVVYSANLVGWSPQNIEYALLAFFSRSDEEIARIWGDLKRAFLRQMPLPARDELLRRLQVREPSSFVVTWPFVKAVTWRWSRLHWRASRETRASFQRRLDRERVALIGRLMGKPQEPAYDRFGGTPDAWRWSAYMCVGTASLLAMVIGTVVYWGWLHSLSKGLAAATLMATAGFLKLIDRIVHNERLLRYYDANKERLRNWDLLHISLNHRPWLPENDAPMAPGLTDIAQALTQFCAAVDHRDAALLSASLDYLQEEIENPPHRGNPPWDVLPYPIRQEFIAWLQEDPHAIHRRDWMGLWAAFYGFAGPASPEEAMFRRAV